MYLKFSTVTQCLLKSILLYTKIWVHLVPSSIKTVHLQVNLH